MYVPSRAGRTAGWDARRPSLFGFMVLRVSPPSSSPLKAACERASLFLELFVFRQAEPKCLPFFYICKLRPFFWPFPRGGPERTSEVWSLPSAWLFVCLFNSFSVATPHTTLLKAERHFPAPPAAHVLVHGHGQFWPLERYRQSTNATILLI